MHGRHRVVSRPIERRQPKKKPARNSHRQHDHFRLLLKEPHLPLNLVHDFASSLGRFLRLFAGPAGPQCAPAHDPVQRTPCKIPVLLSTAQAPLEPKTNALPLPTRSLSLISGLLTIWVFYGCGRPRAQCSAQCLDSPTPLLPSASAAPDTVIPFVNSLASCGLLTTFSLQ